MSGIIRIAIGYFVVHRFQRVLLWMGAVLALVGALVRAASGPGEGLLITGLLLIQLPGLPLAGILFRELSASRACQLVPHARLRLLGSLVLATAGAVLLWPLALSAWGTQALPFGETLMVAFAGATVLVLGAFVASPSRARTGAAGLLGGWTVAAGRPAVAAAGMEPVVLMALASIASLLAWLVFASWYVTARQVAGVWSRLGWPFESLSTAPGTAPPSRVLAVASVFSGVWLEREPWRDPRQVLVLVAVSAPDWYRGGSLSGCRSPS
jgi:hypothetical protein